MRLFLSLLFCINILSGFSIQDSIVSDSLPPADNNYIASFISGRDYEYKSYQDDRTLVYDDKGSVYLSWKTSTNLQSIIGVKYREIHSKEWKEVLFETDSNLVELTNIPENLIYEYKVGTGSSKTNLVYPDETDYFNSIGPTIFESNQAKDKEEGVKITWGIEFNKLTDILFIYPNASYSLKYNTKIGAERNDADSTLAKWTFEHNIPIEKVSHEIKDLSGGTGYLYKIGINLGDKTIWSKASKFKPERAWGLFKFLVLIGSLGMFIFGMKIMSEGLQKAAGARLRNMLGSITSNRFKGVATGFGITAIVQSSSVTTVMTVSFVNAGLMTLKQSAGVMMGANIGTTITAWLILLFGFKVSLGPYALIFIAFGAPLLFFSKGKAKMWASAIIGFALLFLGLSELKDSVPSLGPDSPIVQFFIDFKDAWYAPVMFVFLGALVTVVIQSSSAAMALTMTLVAGNVIPFEVASAMILGENIGTTITAELASLIGNVHAKRSARIHSLFNVIGVTWAILLFPFILSGIAFFIKGDPYTDGNAANVGLAVFHSAFNLINVILLIGFAPRLVRMAERTVKSKGGADEEFHLDYIGAGIMSTPELSILEARKEVAKFGLITSRMSTFTQKLLVEQNKKARTQLHEKILKYEEITDRVEIEVANYLAQVSNKEMSEDTAKKIRSMISAVNDLETIGDVFHQMSKSIERKNELKIWFTPEQRNALSELFKLLDRSFEIMCENLNSDWNKLDLTEANVAEEAINQKRDAMRDDYLSSLHLSEYNVQSGVIYSQLFSLAEKVGDHILNVSEALTGKV